MANESLSQPVKLTQDDMHAIYQIFAASFPFLRCSRGPANTSRTRSLGSMEQRQ